MRNWLIFSIAAVGAFIVRFDNVCVQLGLFSISKHFDITINQSQFVCSVYLIVFVTTLPLFGKLCDIVPRNKLYATGFLLFALGAFMSFLSKTFLSLIAYRCIGALGGSILLSNSIAIITDIFDKNKYGLALGMFATIIAISGILAPIIGGFILGNFSWNFVFIPTIPIAFFAMFFANKFIPNKKNVNKLHFDFCGCIMFLLSILTFNLLISNLRSCGLFSKTSLCYCLIMIVLLIAFFIFEKNNKNPFMDLDVFKDKTILFGNISIILFHISWFSYCILFPFFAQEFLNQHVISVGFILLPYGIANVLFSPIVGRKITTIGCYTLTKTGCILTSFGLFLFVAVDKNTSAIYFAFANFILGLGSAFFQSPVNAGIMSAVKSVNRGINSGLLIFSRNFGMILGSVFSTGLYTVLKNSFVNIEASFLEAYKTAMLVMVFISICGYFCTKKAFQNSNT